MLALLLLVAAQADGNQEAANWSCATPLIEKNYGQSFKPEELARRIVDECARSFVPPETPGAVTPQQTSMFETIHHNLYLANLLSFQMEVKGQIDTLRLKDRIKLRR